MQQALTAYQGGYWEEAGRICRAVLEKHQKNGDALHLLGLMAAQSGQLDEAAELILRALRGNSGNAQLHGLLGNIHSELGRHEQAVQCYDKAIALDPKYALAYANRGSALAKISEYDAAVTSLQRAIALKPDYADAHYNLGNTLAGLGHHEAAVASYDNAIALNPDFAGTYNNRGVSRADLNQFMEALEDYERAIHLAPEFVDAYNNHGVALANLGRYADAMASYEQAISLAPEDADARWNLAATKLLLGDFSSGLIDYGWLWKRSLYDKTQQNFREPLWSGAQDLRGKTILLYSDRGFGDTLQFCRYVKDVAALGATVLLEVQPSLLGLLASLEGVTRILPLGAQRPAFDYHCPIFRLPLAFKTDLTTIPARIPYISSSTDKIALWKTMLGAKTRPRVGVAWSGKPLPDPRRSMRLLEMVPLLRKGVEFFSLQNEVRDTDGAVLSSHLEIRHLGDQIREFADTAALVDLMDLVITIDTSVAHLAGAMGKPVWILLPFNPDWRWLLERNDSPWYPTARLFRQPVIGDWASVVAAVRAELEQYLQQN